MTVIGEDTDLLILLCYHTDHDSPFPLYLNSGKHAEQRKAQNMGHSLDTGCFRA